MKPRAFPGFPANRENSNCPNFSLRQIRNIVCCIVADFSFDFPFFFFNFNIFSDRQKEKKKVEQTRYHLPFPNLISLPRAFIHRKNPSDVDARSPFMRVALLKIHPGKIQRWRNIELRNINISFLCCRSESGANFFQ